MGAPPEPFRECRRSAPVYRRASVGPPSPEEAVMKLTKVLDSRVIRIAAAGAVAAFVLCMSRDARADYCGADGERACTIPEKFPSCNVNLVEGAGRCIRPQCGQ